MLVKTLKIIISLDKEKSRYKYVIRGNDRMYKDKDIKEILSNR